MKNSYQHDFSVVHRDAMFAEAGRKKKAITMLTVLEEAFFPQLLGKAVCLDVGASTGIIDNFLSCHCKFLVGIDIDTHAISHANETFRKDNLCFNVGDALLLPFSDDSLDVVICSQVYEHVPDSHMMMDEIYRVLKTGGICYFAAGNRLSVNEHHYNLPFLSVIPKWLGHLYVRMAGKGEFYYENHLSYWGLKKLVRRFEVTDYTRRMLEQPKRYGVDYMVKPHSLKACIAVIIARYFHWLSPGYIWLLKKT